MIPPERQGPTPADRFNAYLREVDACEAVRPRRRSGVRTTWPQRVAALAIGSVFWGTILAGLSRWLLDWP